MPGLLPTAGLPFTVASSQVSSSSMPILGRMISNSCEHNVSNDSSSPTLSDSGISVDAASNASSARGTASIETALNHRALTSVLSLSLTAPGRLFLSVLTPLHWCMHIRLIIAFTCYLNSYFISLFSSSFTVETDTTSDYW